MSKDLIKILIHFSVFGSDLGRAEAEGRPGLIAGHANTGYRKALGALAKNSISAKFSFLTRNSASEKPYRGFKSHPSEALAEELQGFDEYRTKHRRFGVGAE